MVGCSLPSPGVVTTGNLGRQWRARISPAGTVEAPSGPPLRWLVAADDRWHDPQEEPAVRQQRLAGTPVVETRLRVPRGDIVETVWTVADHGGLTVVELCNDSPLPVAVALTRRDLLTSREPSSTVPAGVELPADSIVLPLGHRSTTTVALSHRGDGAGTLPAGLAAAETVANGWVRRTDAASRLELPDAVAVERVRTARCELMLGGVEAALADERPTAALLALGELQRTGELTAGELDELVPVIAELAGSILRGDGVSGGAVDAAVDAALDASAALFAAADERRALADLERGRRRGHHSAVDGVQHDPDGAELADFDEADPLVVAAVERRLATGSRLFPGGFPSSWMGQNFEAHGLRCGPAGTLSLAVRWHGANPAVLWERSGPDQTLHAEIGELRWSSTEASGEALWQLTGGAASRTMG